jgi:hypothetical protein
METFFKQVEQIVRESQLALEESRKRGEQFNMFKTCGVNHYENTHSAIIAELLNPQGSHGQGSIFLFSFIEVCCSHDFKFSLQGVEVHTEFPIDDGRLDILVKNENEQVIIIENKIYALDQYEQLKRYERYAKKFHDGKYELLYLTLYGSDASENSGKNVKYTRISYQKEIVNWLEVCIKKCIELPPVRETLIQYQNHIKQLTNQSMDVQEKEKLFKEMARHAEATEKIYEIGYDDYLQYVFDHYLKPKLKLFAKEKGLKYGDADTNVMNGFHFYLPEWKKTSISFCSESGRFYYGVTGSKDATRKLIPQKMQCLTDEPVDDWPYGTEFFDKYSCWKVGGGAVLAMMNGNLLDVIKKATCKVLEEIETKCIPMI